MCDQQTNKQTNKTKENTMNHAQLVTNLAKPGNDIADEMTPEKAHLVHMSMCIPEEAGEISGLIKKHVMYNKPIDMDAVIEEMGDLEFYLEGLRQGLGITRAQVLAGNIAKLKKRYASGTYSDTQANGRADKK